VSGWHLRLRAPPPLRIDLRALAPAVLAGMDMSDIERLPLAQGRASVAVAELFDVAQMDRADTLHLEGDLSRFDFIGCGLVEGRIEIDGLVGHYLGAGLRGGRIHVRGHALDAAGCEMAGGEIEIDGNVGDFAAGAQPGSMDGMRGGTLVVRGNAGQRLADRMRRGTLVVFGDAGDFAASRMVAGTLAVAGRLGAHPAWGMRRGTLLCVGPAPELAPTFVPVRAQTPVFWQLLARDLARFAGPFAMLASRRVERYVGDLAVGGKGEVLTLR
jgi:formylmethanofuran dehydrogenase subunit C